MSIKWKTVSYVVLDTILAVYLILAITSFTMPDHQRETCNEVKISISDEENYGFLSAYDIKTILEEKGLYPQTSPLNEVDTRKIEETLENNSFVDKVECYKTISGTVNIKVNQRMPFIRVMADNGDNYYLDKDGNMMQGEGYTSDLIIATGNISRQYAKDYLAPVSRFITASDFWRYQIEQINILSNGDMEIVPRVGNHSVKIGRLPQYKDKERRDQEIEKFLDHKLQRLEKFYVYGLTKIGWNKYKYINIEFDNQIICTKNGKSKADEAKQIEAMSVEQKGDKEKESVTKKDQESKNVKEQKQ
ncbi:MAG: cell division protein FtsQ [Prevotella sp.]|nr:cell division protein FtsQ [Prevotella sp.]